MSLQAAAEPHNMLTLKKICDEALDNAQVELRVRVTWVALGHANAQHSLLSPL